MCSDTGTVSTGNTFAFNYIFIHYLCHLLSLCHPPLLPPGSIYSALLFPDSVEEKNMKHKKKCGIL
jgi:hypothetical protein